MSFVAEASILLDVSPEVAFDKLADHPSWVDWMPPTFRPAGASRGKLEAGSRFKAYIARLPFPTPIEVYVVDRAKEITWGGGSPLLAARHRFLFEAEGSGTRVRSVETWEGGARSCGAPHREAARRADRPGPARGAATRGVSILSARTRAILGPWPP